jgi:hypothetical protein
MSKIQEISKLKNLMEEDLKNLEMNIYDLETNFLDETQ